VNFKRNAKVQKLAQVRISDLNRSQHVNSQKITNKHLLLWCPVLVSVVFFWQARRSKKLEKKALAHYKETQKVDLNKLP